MAECKITRKITNGPSKFDLAIALFHKPTNGDRDHLVTFVLTSGREVKVVLRGMTMESGGHENWLFEGYDVSPEGDWKPIKGYYETHTRNGHFEYIAPKPTASQNPPSPPTFKELIPIDKNFTKNNVDKIILGPVDGNIPSKLPKP